MFATVSCKIYIIVYINIYIFNYLFPVSTIFSEISEICELPKRTHWAGSETSMSSSPVNGFFRSPTVTVRSHSLVGQLQWPGLHSYRRNTAARNILEPHLVPWSQWSRIQDWFVLSIVASCSHMCCFCARFHSPQAIATIGTIQCRIHQMKQDETGCATGCATGCS